ncbi:sulfur carrier protein ThiS [Sulfurivirga caldicuralii]|uniref:Sulfur carrier protein ThiS n=1 Tax=Sulfurivirga caldicuralii TaxID=364032 RepID=A0A1N6DGI1_9GAMM|nr:sulfur carrier protein ThiS [Sulfurivirga caldicuralii]SIN69895.1 sulfur carrier protein ThiS [Sulfurivirga caldicuralii]
MQIILNGEPYELKDGATAAELVQQLELTGKRIAMERNETIVPRSQYEQTELQPGDRIEIIHAVGGG